MRTLVEIALWLMLLGPFAVVGAIDAVAFRRRRTWQRHCNDALQVGNP